jgi:hypothetical protein
MDIKKVNKNKTFSKRLALILSEIKGASRDQQDEGIAALLEVAKLGSDFLELASLAILFKSKYTDEILSNAAVLCANVQSQFAVLVALNLLAGNESKVDSLLATPPKLSFLNKLMLSWVLTRFSSRTEMANRLTKEATNEVNAMEDNSWALEIIAKCNSTPPKPPVDSSYLRFHIQETTFKWDGFAK